MPIKICFLSLGAQSYFSMQTEKVRFAGGGSKKLALIGQVLSKKGYEVYFVTYGSEFNKIKKINNVFVLNVYDPYGVQKINLFSKIHQIWAGLRKIDPDILVYSHGSPGVTAIYCLLKRKKYIYWMASDKMANLNDIESNCSIFKKIAFFLDIKLSKMIVVQNKFQKNIFDNKFQKKNILIKNPAIIPDISFKIRKKLSSKIILWVGHLSRVKQPELFLELAKNFPQCKFKMIGGKDLINPEIYENVEEKSKELSNLEFLGFIPPTKIQKYYQEAAIFVNTSESEGFPNTLLEALTNYTPIVSLNVNPDEIINKYRLGLHSRNFEQMVKDIKTLIENPNLREKMGRNGRKYVEKNHDIKKVANQFENLVKNLINK